MGVLEQRQMRGGLGQPLEQRDQRADRPLLLFARRHFERGISSLERDREQGGEQSRSFLRLHRRAGHQGVQLVEPRGRGFAAAEAGRVTHLADDGIERVVDVVRRALIPGRHMRRVADPLAQRREHARLADAGLAREQRDLALALGRVAPSVQQQRDLALSSDERGHAMRSRRLEPADVLGLPHDRPGGSGRVEPLQRLESEGLQFERPAQQPTSGLGDEHAPRLGQGLQTRRQIGRVADHGLFLRRSRSDEIADDDDAGRYADADLQRLTGGSFELPGDRRDVQRRPDRPFGVFFMGAREAEIGENAVAHEFRDKPVVARHRARTGVLVAADDIAHVLGIEPRRQRG